MIFKRKYGINILSGTQETFEALSHFLYNLEVTLKEYKTNEQLIEYLISKNVIIEDKEKALRNIERYSYYSIVNGYKSVFKDEDNTYNFIPPFVLTKILTFGAISRYYGLLKQNDRQEISKYFKISDKLLKQILVNLTMIRNISAHSDRLFCYRNKYYISFKNIDKNYKRNGNFTNIYMIIQCMKVLLDEEKFKEFEDLFNIEVNKLKDKLNSININDILRIMGFNV